MADTSIIAPICVLIGAVVGGSISLINTHLQLKAKNRENLDLWFERFCISEGVEPVIIYLNLIQDKLGMMSEGFFASPYLLPVQALQRLTILLGHDRASNILKQIYEDYEKKEFLMQLKANEFNIRMQGILLVLESELLEARIEKKSDILCLKDKGEIKKVADAVRNISTEIEKMNAFRNQQENS